MHEEYLARLPPRERAAVDSARKQLCGFSADLKQALDSSPGFEHPMQLYALLRGPLRRSWRQTCITLTTTIPFPVPRGQRVLVITARTGLSIGGGDLLLSPGTFTVTGASGAAVYADYVPDLVESTRQ